MRIKISFLILVTVFATDSYSQRVMHAVGVNLTEISGRSQSVSSSNKWTIAQALLSYFPRYNFIENDNSSFSVGAPIGVGLGIATTMLKDDAGLAFAYDLPIVADYNFGCKSTRENEKKWGGYVGVGYSYHSVNISGSRYSDFTGVTYGPMARAGVRFRSFAEDWYGRGITVGFYYKKGMEASKIKTFGISVFGDL